MDATQLIIDDDPGSRELVRVTLQRYLPGSRQLTAATAMEGLAMAARERPDLAIVDVNLPDLSGIEVCRRLRAQPETADISILVYTGFSDDAEHRVAAFESGAEGFLAKPFTAMELVAQVKAILRARHSETLYRAIVQDQTEWICRWKPDGTLTFVNGAYARECGCAAETLIGQNFLQRLPLAPRERLLRHLSGLTGETPTTTVELELNAPGEALHCQQWTARGLFDGRGHLREVQSVGRDVTALKATEQDLLTAKARAEQANYAKSVLLAGVSHELRTPMNAILGFSQVLDEGYFGALSEKHREYVHEILASGQHLLRLIDSIMEVANLDAMRARLEVDPVVAGALLEDGVSTTREQCVKRGVRFGLHVPAEIAARTLLVDPRKVKQVLLLLLSNAVKFTPRGGAIDVTATACEELLSISVADTGQGIAPRHHEEIFEEFFQVNQGRTDKTPGVGLGLPLVRRLVKLWGGQVWVESEGVGKGSRFTFTLPHAGRGQVGGTDAGG